MPEQCDVATCNRPARHHIQFRPDGTTYPYCDYHVRPHQEEE